MHRARYGVRGMDVPCPLWSYHPPRYLQAFINRKLSEPLPLGFLWRLHYVAVIDQILGGW